jgi:hypothetical protein
MAIVNLIDTTFTAKNISTALSVYEYTVPGTALWYHLYVQVRLVAVAGGGDYTINLRLNDGDVQTDDPMVPKTTYTAAAGAQNIWFAGEVVGNSGDVLNIMCLGQAGDTAVIGSIRICCDDAVGVTTYGRTLDVQSTGEAGLDFSNIKAADNPTTLTNITVPTVASVTALAAGAIPDNEIDAGAIKADAVTKIQAGLSTLTAAQVWSYATRTLSSFGALIADIWSYVNRTLTQSAAEAAESTNPGTLALKRGDSWSQAITDLGSLAGYTYIDFTVKRSEKDLDEDAIIRIRKAASGLGDGLLTLNEATGTATSGSITIDDAALGNITIALAATATDDLELDKGLYYDIQKIVSTTVTTIGSGVLNVTADITRAVT